MTFKRAIVTAVGPLRILIDGDTVPIPFTPKSLIDPATLAVDDVVHANQSGHRLLVLGRSGGLGLVSGRNLIINGGFRINQHDYVSGAVSNGYDFFDRWEKLENTSGTLFTAAPQGQPITLGDASSSRHVRQTVARANLPAGIYVLSHAGTATARVYNKGGTAPSYASTPIVVTLDGTDDVRVEFEGYDTTIGKVQLERGTVPTPFMSRLYGAELALCQRYYVRFKPSAGVSDAGLLSGAIYSTGVFYGIMNLPVSMRAAPTLSYSDVSHFSVFTDGSSITVTSVILNVPGNLTQQIRLAASGATQGHAAWARITTTSGWMAFDAEL